MLIDFDYIKSKYDMNINGVVHIGAHFGQEIQSYLEDGAEKVVCFEPLSKNLEVLRKQESDKVKVFPYALGEEEKSVMMFVSNNDRQSSSVLAPKKHLDQHPGVLFLETEVVNMKTLNSFADDILGCNYMSIDVQGYEYQVFLGGSEVLGQFDYIYCEVNRDETYENNHLVTEIDELLHSYGLVRCETSWDGNIWGDALYIKENLWKSN
jgi:FkbM family methyltransferase